MRAHPVCVAVAVSAVFDLAAAAPLCPVTTTPSTWSGVTLETGTTRSGVVFDGARSQLALQPAAGRFTSTQLGIADATVFAAPADFDSDGWTDFVGAGEATTFIRIYRNRTFDNPAPDWTVPTAVRTPKFVNVRELQAATSSNGWRPIAAADFDGNGWPDVFVAQGATSARPTSATLWLNKGANDASGNPQFKSGYAAMASGSAPSDLGIQSWGGTSITAVDYNGDRKLDLLVGSGESNGSIRVFLNTCTLATVASPPAAPAPLPCSNSPTFRYASTLATNLGFPAGANLPVFGYADVDGDGVRDLAVAAPSCCTAAGDRLRLYKGVAGGGLASTPQSITFQGGATVVFLADFSGDGKADLIVGTDNWNYNPDHGGDAYYWVNNASATPFSGTPQKLTSYNYPTFYDYDVGFTFDYDHDPSHTLDMMVADGNHTASFYVQANRVISQYVDCGDVASGVVSPTGGAGGESVVTAARITPSATLAGGTIAYYLSNEEPPNWVRATDCGDHSGDLCATFPKPIGREVRWKATMCSNATHTQTPTLTSIAMRFDYTPARDYFRAGVVLSDGVAYLGGFRQPGDRGHLYALDAALTTTYWDAATLLDAADDSARHIYTATTTGTSRLYFDTAHVSNAQLLATLGVADAATAANVVMWARGKRFGVGNAGIASSRLGALETSTPALLGAPGTPWWLRYASPLDRAAFQTYRTAQAHRPTLVLFGSRDGMIHAIRSDATAISTRPSGDEAWAFVPPRVASGMLADYTASLASGATVATAYPDGSPTLADYRRADGSYGTVAIVSSGNGGKSLMALDVTETIASDGAVVGPTPLWTATPGEADAGQGYAKPAVARVRIGGAERFIAIAGTGVAHDNPAPPYTKGRIVAAYDVATGAPLWKFQMQCALTSDITVFETDDAGEAGGPVVDGFADRAVFADACGFVYKVDPARDLAGGWNVNAGLGGISVERAGGTVDQYALFATRLTPLALGTDSPIAGTLGAQVDATGREVLFFGTGGVESHATTAANAFYAIYADTGEVRSVWPGRCSSAGCEKFYGGVLVTATQVMFTRTVDPAVATGRCDLGATTVSAVALDGARDHTFVEYFSQATAAAVMGALYGDAGAVYFAMLSGGVSRIGTPRAPSAGGDSASGTDTSTATDSSASSDQLVNLGWTQTY